jgi:hypothetical protein
LNREAVEARARRLGPTHPDTLRSMINLGIVCRHAGKLEEAERVLQSTLEQARILYASKHPAGKEAVSRAMLSLINVYEASSKAEEVAEWQQKLEDFNAAAKGEIRAP